MAFTIASLTGDSSLYRTLPSCEFGSQISVSKHQSYICFLSIPTTVAQSAITKVTIVYEILYPSPPKLSGKKLFLTFYRTKTIKEGQVCPSW